MKIFLHDEKTGGVLREICQRAKVDILTLEEVQRRQKKSYVVYPAFFNEVEAVILEITLPSPIVNFILAQALLASKPVLCLYAKNQLPRNLLQLLHQHQGQYNIKPFSYMGENLTYIITKFLLECTPKSEEPMEAADIKFTLRLTKQLDKYLSWICQKQNVPKADFVRDLIQREALEDKLFTEENI